MPSLDPCTSLGMGHLGWGSSPAPDLAQPGQHLLCLGVLLQDPQAAVVEPFHPSFWGGAHGCHHPLPTLSVWEEIPWLKCLTPLLPQFPQMRCSAGAWGHEGWVSPGSEAQQHSLQSC